MQTLVAHARRGGALAPRSAFRSASSPGAPTDSARAITPVLDAMQIVPAFAYLMPVVILFSIGPARRSRLDDDLRDPAVHTDHGARYPRRRGQHRRGGDLDGRDAIAAAPQGPASARATDDPAWGQPDDSLRPLDGRHRRPDRWRWSRRRRNERPVLQSGAGHPRGSCDRDPGDGSRPLDRGDGRRGPTRTRRHLDERGRDGCGIHHFDRHRHPRRRRTLEGARVAALYPDEVGDLPRDRRRSRNGCSNEDPGRARLREDPTTWSSHHRAHWNLHPRGHLLLPLQAVPRRGAVVHDGARADGYRVRDQWSSTRP